VFLHIPKTAGSTFQFILENTFGLRACHTGHTKQRVFGPADLAFAKKMFPGLRSLAGHNLIDPLTLGVRDAFHVTLVREPMARIFSHYQEKFLRGTNRRTFEDSLRSGHWYQNAQVTRMAGGPDLDKAKRYLEKCDFVGVTEKFDLSLHVLSKLSPCRLNLNYTRLRSAADNSIRKSLEQDGRLVDMAREFNQLDFELYSFAVNEVFPRLCEKAGLNPSQEVPSFNTYDSRFTFNYMANRLYNLLVYRQALKLRR